MKFLLVADLHLGYRQYGMEGRENDFYAALDKVCDLAIGNGVDVVVAGDMFDTAKPPAAAVLRMKQFVERLGSHGLGVYGIEGNHDATRDSYWLRVCGITPLCDDVVTVRGTRFFGFNYGKPEEVYAKMRQLDSVDVIVTHAGFVEMQGDYTSQYSTRQFAEAARAIGCKCVANGHIHLWAEVHDDGVTFIQPGSLELKSVDEPKLKQAALVEVTESGATVTPLKYQTRDVRIEQIDNEFQFGEFLKDLSAGKFDGSLSVLYVSRDIEDAAERFEKAVEGHPTMWRFIPTEGHEAAVERKTISSLAEAIEAYFEKGSAEYDLIARCLQTPENASGIALDYINGEEGKEEDNGGNR